MPCEDCTFWLRAEATRGACRRMPPTAGFVPGYPIGVGFFPVTDGAQWCGEWLKREELAKPQEPPAEEHLGLSLAIPQEEAPKDDEAA